MHLSVKYFSLQTGKWFYQYDILCVMVSIVSYLRYAYLQYKYIKSRCKKNISSSCFHTLVKCWISSVTEKCIAQHTTLHPFNNSQQISTWHGIQYMYVYGGISVLIHCGPPKTYGDTNISQHSTIYVITRSLTAPIHYPHKCWLFITSIHLRAISQGLPRLICSTMCLDIHSQNF